MHLLPIGTSFFGAYNIHTFNVSVPYLQALFLECVMELGCKIKVPTYVYKTWYCDIMERLKRYFLWYFLPKNGKLYRVTHGATRLTTKVPKSRTDVEVRTYAVILFCVHLVRSVMPFRLRMCVGNNRRSKSSRPRLSAFIGYLFVLSVFTWMRATR